MRLRLVLCLAPVLSSFLLGCGSGTTTTLSTSTPSTNIVVAVTPAAAQAVDAGQTVALTAMVTNDQGGKGVTWTVTPGGGSVATATGLTNTYTAPAGEALNVQVTATSVADPTKSAAATINVAALPAFSTTSPIPMGYLGIAYTATLPAAGGVGGRTYSVLAGTVPPGLTVASNGAITGTPTALGSYTFTAQVTDSAATPVKATATFTVIVGTLTINPIQLSGGIVGTAYPSATLTASAALGNVTYTLASGSLPAGLTLSSNGLLSGNPTTAGTSNFSVRATDTAGQTTTLQFAVTVAAKLAFANVALPAANVGTPIANTQLATTGGTAPSSFALATGSTLPPGLALTNSGLLSGTPTAAGDYSFNVVVTDHGSSTGGATPPQQTATGTVTLHVSSFALAGGTLPAANANVAYSTTLVVTGGTSPYTYAVTGGALPAGLALNPANGVISGTPTTAGIYALTVTVTDANGRTATGSYSLTVNAPLGFSTASTLPAATANAAYTTTIQANGGTSPYTYVVTGGALPAGLVLSTGGVLSGTPSAAGTYTFTVMATDSTGLTGSGQFTLTVVAPLTFAPVALPQATLNAPIDNYSFTPTGGTAPYTFAVAAGSTLPAGLSLSTAGVLSGTPTVAGSYSFGVTATDSSGQTATSTATLTVAAGFAITNTALPNVVPYSPYSTAINTVGGTGTVTYAMTAGSLPTNITLNAATGKIEGTTQDAAGAFSITVRVTDSSTPAKTATKTLQGNVSATLSAGVDNALLRGTYAFTFTGFTNGATPGHVYGTASVGVFTFDGNGGVTGTYDVNSAIGGYLASQTISNGSYRLNADQRGTLVFTSNGVVTTLTINAAKLANGVATQVKLLQFNDNQPTDPTLLVGGGTATLQTLTSTALTGYYVFDMRGETSAASAGTGLFGAESAGGYLTLTPAGLIAGGSEDGRVFGNDIAATGLVTGTYGVTDAALGRGTMQIANLGGPHAPSGFVFYLVSPTQLYLMSTDSHQGSYDLLSGTARQRSATAVFTNASLSGTVIGYDSGSVGGDGQTMPQSGTYADVYRLLFDGAGTVTVNGYTNQNGMAFPLPASRVTYAVDANGRVTFTGGALNPIYLTDTNTAQGVSRAQDNTGNGTVRLEPQTATALTDGTFGFASQQTTDLSYGFLGTVTTVNSALSAEERVNYVLFDGTGSDRLFTQTRPFDTTFTVDAGTGLIQLGPANSNYTGYVVNGGKFVTVQIDPNNTPNEAAVIFEQ